ncbi:MAG: LEA type 2 family protein [Desulfobacterales bacterium]|nr:LEA type 2 family protein [Desulfobacterales bacterium]
MKHPQIARSTAIIAAACCAFILISCSAFTRSLEKPTLDIVDFRVLEARLLEQRYSLVFRVKNPNAMDLPVTGVHYNLKLEGEDFANGVSSKPFLVPAYGESEFEIEVTTSLFRIIQQLASLMSQPPKELNYEIRGQIRVDKVFIGNLAFNSKGKIQMPKATIQQ